MNIFKFYLSSSGMGFLSGPNHFKSRTNSGFCTLALQVKNKFFPTGFSWFPCGSIERELPWTAETKDFFIILYNRKKLKDRKK